MERVTQDPGIACASATPHWGIGRDSIVPFVRATPRLDIGTVRYAHRVRVATGAQTATHCVRRTCAVATGRVLPLGPVYATPLNSILPRDAKYAPQHFMAFPIAAECAQPKLAAAEASATAMDIVSATRIR